GVGLNWWLLGCTRTAKLTEKHSPVAPTRLLKANDNSRKTGKYKKVCVTDPGARSTNGQDFGSG
ncbi:hypothetical protein NKY70_32085, partial [Sinorhizobium meliloti]|uniref:hypothetical protein n=1 Tax=Rhizobium meliloti TaxID=382 RepID=UPI003D645931